MLAPNVGGGADPLLNQGDQHQQGGGAGHDLGRAAGQKLGRHQGGHRGGDRFQLVMADAPGQPDQAPGPLGEAAPQPQAGQVERGAQGGLDDPRDGLVGAQLLGGARGGLGQLVGAERRRGGLGERFDLDVLVGVDRAVHGLARRRRGFH